MRMLWYKAWLETRFRFLIGAVMIAGCCGFFVLGNPFILGTWREWELLHPHEREPDWLLRAAADYPFFIWHFLFQSTLQQLWVLFALLLGLGGLSREGAQGTAGFSLSLPVSRRRMVTVRAAVGSLEMAALGLLPALLLPALSLFIGKPYPVMQGITHVILMMLAGIAFFSLGLFLATTIQSEFAPTLIGVTFVAFFYFIFQPYADGVHEPLWLRLTDLQRVMAGTPERTFSAASSLWGVGAGLLVTLILFFVSLRITERKDY